VEVAELSSRVAALERRLAAAAAGLGGLGDLPDAHGAGGTAPDATPEAGPTPYAGA
jgi:hypothetical protein